MSKSLYLAGGLLAAALFASAEARAADPQPVGARFRPSNCTNCTQVAPRVAGATSGAFSVVWDGSSSVDPKGILRRRFNATGVAQGGDAQVNTDPQLEQTGGDIAVDPKGNYVVVWASLVGGKNYDIFARRYQANGTAVGSVIQVSADETGTPTIPQDTAPSVAAGLDGGFVVTWTRSLPASNTFSGTRPEIWIRRFTPAGTPVRAQLKLSTSKPSGDRPDVCVDSLNRAVVVWTVVDDYRPFEPSLEGVVARRLSPAGAPVGTELVVAAPTSKSANSAVSCGANSTFVATWQTNQPPALDRLDIVARRYTRAGTPAGAAFLVNANTEGDQKIPAIAHDTTGAFIIAWERDNQAGAGITARRYSAAGTALSAEIQVDSVPDGALKPEAPSVAGLAAGQFVIVWQDGKQKLFGQRYKP
jgi:hypothetical protein